MDEPNPGQRTHAGRLERADSALTLVGPLAIGLAAAAYGVVARHATIGGALVAGWALWQLSVIAVICWRVAMTEDDPHDAARIRAGYKPRRRR
jgi:hypothetical protein